MPPLNLSLKFEIFQKLSNSKKDSYRRHKFSIFQIFGRIIYLFIKHVDQTRIEHFLNKGIEGTNDASIAFFNKIRRWKGNFFNK